MSDLISVQGGNYKFQDVMINGVSTKCLVPEVKPKFTDFDLREGARFEIPSTYGGPTYVRVHKFYHQDNTKDALYILFSEKCYLFWTKLNLTDHVQNKIDILAYLNKLCEKA